MVFAGTEALLPFRASDLGFDYFFPVEPMFDMIPFHQNTAFIPFAYRLDGLIVSCRIKVIHGSCSLEWITAITVLVVIQNLILEAKASTGAVFYTGVAAFGNLPFKFQFEVLVVLLGNNIARFDAAAIDDSIVDRPVLAYRAPICSGPGAEVA